MEVTQQVDDKRIAGLLVTAFERFVEPKDPKPVFDAGEKTPRLYKHCDYPLHADGAVIVADMEDGAKEYTLDRASIERGLQVMAKESPYQFGQFMAENDDACTGDVFVQCCLFGKVVYG